MTKDELKTGYVVQRRNGSYALVIKDSFDGDKFIAVDNDFKCLTFDRYANNLIFDGETKWDIMKVFKSWDLTITFRYLSDKQYDKLTLLWTRESPKELQLKGLVEKLQSQLNSAQEELMKLEVN